MDVIATRQGAFTDDTKGTSLWPLVASHGVSRTVMSLKRMAGIRIINFSDHVRYIQRNNADGGTGETSSRCQRLVTRVSVMTVSLPLQTRTVVRPATRTVLSKSKIADLSAASVTISEIMVDTR